MRILFSTVSPANYMRPPSLGDEQIVCGPDWVDDVAPDGRVRSLRTPVGAYDLGQVLARIPADQQPDAVVCLVDASWRNQPRHLVAFRGPKALLVADTHHLKSPLIGLLRYAGSEPYDRVIFLYDRHHLGFFASAGFRNLHWFPGLTFPHDDAAVRAARRSRREAHLAFVGQTGKYHPQRARLLSVLQSRGLPVVQRPLPQAEALAFYGGSLAGFNASLNGDLNLRIFEILASGALLLTDRLAPASGLSELLADGRELLTYGSAAELAERAAHALAHPREAAAIGAAGAAWFDTHFPAARRAAAFRSLLCDGTSLPEFAVPTPRRYFQGDIHRLLQSLVVYEGAQELHRTQETLRVVLAPGVPEDVAEIYATLPRAEVVRAPLATVADLAVLSRDDDFVPGAIRAPRVWCCDAEPAEHAVLAEMLQPAGFTAASADVPVFCRADASDPQAAVAAGDAHGLLGCLARPDAAAARAGLEPLIRQHPQRATVWHALGLALHGAGRLADGVASLLHATTLAPADLRLQLDLARLSLELGHGALAAEAAAAVLAAEPGHADARRLREEAAALVRAAGSGPRDLLLCHVEVTHRQGTGVLLQRLFPEADAFLTIRSRSFHRGEVEFGGRHFSLDVPGLPAGARPAILGRLLASYRIRRILAVPYFATDFEHALAAKALTGAPLCTFAMDDQAVYCRQVPRELAQRVFAVSDLRLAISPEMAEVYSRTFGRPFHFMPPVLTDAADAVPNHWTPAAQPANRVAMLGNVWTAKRFVQLRDFVRRAGWTVDWYGPGPSASWLRADPAGLAADGIHCRGFLPEAELVAALAGYAAVLVPSGMLDETEDNEAFSRLSLPSRMLFVLVKTRTPMLVLGSPETAAGRFVLRHGIGLCTSFDPAEAAARLRRLTEPASRAACLAAAEAAAACYVLPDAGQWIWQSLAQRQPRPAPFRCAATAAATPTPTLLSA
ncbi:MAG: glycosyltransferase [Opitutaceae bacterium]|nr:glycosyltransferase [Opitutaceae bacterium]